MRSFKWQTSKYTLLKNLITGIPSFFKVRQLKGHLCIHGLCNKPIVGMFSKKPIYYHSLRNFRNVSTKCDLDLWAPNTTWLKQKPLDCKLLSKLSKYTKQMLVYFLQMEQYGRMISVIDCKLVCDLILCPSLFCDSIVDDWKIIVKQDYQRTRRYIESLHRHWLKFNVNQVKGVTLTKVHLT